MSKRKATSDIHPDVRDGSPATSRFKVGDTHDNSIIPNVSKSLGIAATPSFSTACSKTPGLLSLGREPTARDMGTVIPLESLAPKLPKDDLIKQQNASNATATGLLTCDVAGGSLWDCDPTTMRSRYFMENMAELNRSFATWISSCINDDPTAILTRVFIDHQRHAQALFNEEREHTVDLDKLLVLRAQEKVLQKLREADDDDDSVSSCGSDDSEDKTALINGDVAAKEACPVTATPLVLSSPNTAPQKQTLNPFLNNNAINGMKPSTPSSKPTDQADGVVKDCESKLPEAAAEKPMNFASFSFASACQAAAKAAAAKEQVSEEPEDDTPPKVEFTPVQEEGAVYTKRCKIFFKKEKEDGYEDRGIGNLFVKPVSSSNRHQLIVRSETSLGNLLVNVLLSPDIPIKKMGDKNVMLVMIPTPGSTIRIVMVRMKDGADEVVEMLTKYSTI